MAQKRMFNRDFVTEDCFLDLSLDAKLLYFYLVLNADDDGFLANATAICRLLGTSKDTIKELTKAGYVIDFGTGVFLIVHFKLHNTIKADRYHETVYVNERSQVGYDEVKKIWKQIGTNVEPQYSIDLDLEKKRSDLDLEKIRSAVDTDKQVSSIGTNTEPRRNQDGNKMETQKNTGNYTGQYLEFDGDF